MFINSLQEEEEEYDDKGKNFLYGSHDHSVKNIHFVVSIHFNCSLNYLPINGRTMSVFSWIIMKNISNLNCRLSFLFNNEKKMIDCDCSKLP